MRCSERRRLSRSLLRLLRPRSHRASLHGRWARGVGQTTPPLKEKRPLISAPRGKGLAYTLRGAIVCIHEAHKYRPR